MFQSQDILKQEEEFLKLNKEIDMKTLDLMNEVHNIKELQTNNEELYKEMEKTERSFSNEDKKITGSENQSDFDSVNNFSEDTNMVNDYLMKLKNEINESFNASYAENAEGNKTKETEVAKREKKGQRNMKLSKSAKTISTAVLSKTDLGQDCVLPFGPTRPKSHVKLKEHELDDEVLPESMKEMGYEGVTRFLTAKVKLLTEQVQIMQKDERKNLEKIKELQTHKDKSDEEREKLTQQVNMTKNVLIKYEQYTNGVQVQLQNAQAENGHLKKEVENLKKEMRLNNQNSNANELRLNRTLEEVEKLKTALKQVKQEEKDAKDLYRKKIDELTSSVKKLDRQRIELLNGFKKQLIIIDNLKKQKELIEAAKLLKCAEEDFINFLECNPQNRQKRRELTRSAKI